MSSIDFRTLTAPIPLVEKVTAQYAQVQAHYDGAKTTAQRVAAVHEWDQLRRQVDTWSALAQLRFEQDTRVPSHREAREYADEISPKLIELAVAFKRKLVNSPHRAELQAALGPQAFALWESDILTYDPVIEQDLVTEKKLEAEYKDLQANARAAFRGKTYNLSEITKFREDPDRTVRYESERARWGWFSENAQTMDRIYGDLVRLRHGMAVKLKFENFIGLGYKRMCRVDYNQDDVTRYREAVRRHVVPLCLELKKRQASELGLDRLMYWDEGIHDLRGNPAPRGDHDWMLLRAQEMFDGLGGGLGEFFRLMTDGHLLDLKSRDGKTPGGFCTSFPSLGIPFIFANFNGTKGDVEVFTHEMGHAFQGYSSRTLPLSEYLWPTYESCEIHSMGLEFLAWPYMEKFFEQDAQRFRRIHLLQAILFLPYGVAIDHFQHLVYARPEATPDERAAMWRQMEQTYLPWRDYGDLPHLGGGRFWQFQRHLYFHAFYYIDYTLAQCCALQLWVQSRKDFPRAMQTYVELCRRGGELPFQQLVRSAGLVSPFADGCLTDVVQQARSELGV